MVEKQKNEQTNEFVPSPGSPNRIIGAKGPMSRDDFSRLSLEEQKEIVTKMPSYGLKVSK